MSELPDFGEGPRTTRQTRRLTLIIAGVLIAIIAVAVVYAIAS
jgi:hypothetical protein